MKYAVIIAAGAADFPLDCLQGKTALECADLPETSQIAAQGVVGQVQTIQQAGAGPNSCRSDLAFTSLSGFVPDSEVPSRGILEAAGLDVKLEPNQTVVGCNFVTLSDGKMSDATAGNLTDQEANELIDFAKQKIANEDLNLLHVRGSRGLLIASKGLGGDLRLTDPKDVVGTCIQDLFPRGAQSEVLCQITDDSVDWFADHPVNQRRAKEGKPLVTCLWFSDIGQPNSIAAFQDETDKSACLVSSDAAALGWAKGQAMRRLTVAADESTEAESSSSDANLSSLGNASVQALNDSDIVFVFSDIAEQASLQKDAQAKTNFMQQLDHLVVKPIIDALQQQPEWRILVCPDKIRSAHDCKTSNSPVCFTAAGTGIASDDFQQMDEPTAAKSGLKFKSGNDLLRWFLGY